MAESSRSRTEAEDDTINSEDAGSNDMEQSVSAVSIKYHEIMLGDVVVDEVSPAEKFRNKMSEDAQALDEARTYDPAAAAGTAAGAGSLCIAGALARIIRYRRDF